MTSFKLTPETTARDLYRYARDAIQGPLPAGPLLEAFRERATDVDLWWYTRRFGPTAGHLVAAPGGS